MVINTTVGRTPRTAADRLSRLAVLLVAFLLSMATVSRIGAAPRQGSGQDIKTNTVLPPAADIAAALQRRYAEVLDFSADFTQTYEGSVLRRKAREGGTVFIKKPGKMRWEYTVSPEKKLIVSDGQTIFMYFPVDKQVLTNPVPQQDQATSAMLFLLGKGDVTRDFTVRYGDDRGDSSAYVLRLDPRVRQAEYDWLQVTIDRKTLQIRELVWGDAQAGRNTIALSNFKENARLADKMFQFSIPRGTEVISSGKIP
jgi:outer membrane lipoprotein carrier protein